MSARKPTMYVIAGCNGAGKTTFAKEYLLKEVGCLNFLNADYLAIGLSPLSPEIAAMKAGRLLLSEFKSFVARRETFALESTLSGLGYLRMLKEAQKDGFEVCIHFLWLPTPSKAISRVQERVKKGGHNVPAADVRRRYSRGLNNFIDQYAPQAQSWAVWNNLNNPPELMADSETCAQADLRSMLSP